MAEGKNIEKSPNIMITLVYSHQNHLKKIQGVPSAFPEINICYPRKGFGVAHLKPLLMNLNIHLMKWIKAAKHELYNSLFPAKQECKNESI